MKVATILLNLAKRIFTKSDETLAEAKAYTDSALEYVGTYTQVSGTMVTKSWAIPTSYTAWTAPRPGIYLMEAHLSPATDQAMATNYKQFRHMGTVTDILGDITKLYANDNNHVVSFGWAFVVKATAAGQTVIPYLWTNGANYTWNVKIVGLYLAPIKGGGNS